MPRTSTPARPRFLSAIDTPGHVDFTAEVERTLRVVDGMIALFCAVGGVEPQSETVWRQAERYSIPRIAFVNKMDRVGADFFRVVAEMRERLQANPVPVVVPIGEEEGFAGLINLVEMTAVFFGEGETRAEEIPPDLFPKAKALREALLEAVAEADARFLELFLAGEMELAEIKSALRRATIAGAIVPVFSGSAAELKGVRELLDGVVDFSPAPSDLPPVRGTWKGKEVFRAPDVREPLAALVFKIQADRHVGKVYHVRVYSGVLRSGAAVLNPKNDVQQRVGRLFQVHANERVPVDELRPGEVGALIGLGEAQGGDTLCSPEAPILLEPMKFPAPVMDLAISPARRTEADRLTRAIAALVAEDPTLSLRTNPETGEMVVSGMGELHLEIVVGRLRREFGVEVVTGGHGQYAHLIFRIEPAPPGTGLQFETRVVGGRIPKEFIPAVRKGVGEGMAHGPHGFPVVDLKFILLDGSFHEVDSSEQAFRHCAAQALRGPEAHRNNGPRTDHVFGGHRARGPGGAGGGRPLQPAGKASGTGEKGRILLDHREGPAS